MNGSFSCFCEVSKVFYLPRIIMDLNQNMWFLIYEAHSLPKCVWKKFSMKLGFICSRKKFIWFKILGNLWTMKICSGVVDIIFIVIFIFKFIMIPLFLSLSLSFYWYWIGNYLYQSNYLHKGLEPYCNICKEPSYIVHNHVKRNQKRKKKKFRERKTL